MSRRQPRYVAALAATAVLFAAPHARPGLGPDPATTTSVARIQLEIPTQSFDTYCRVATDVVYGRVLAQEPFFPEVGVPYTQIDFAVDISLLGRLNGTQALRVAGARAPGRTAVAPAAPVFEDGDEVLLFLWRAPGTDAVGILGLQGGTYRAQPGPSGVPVLYGAHARGERLDAFLGRANESVARQLETE